MDAHVEDFTNSLIGVNELVNYDADSEENNAAVARAQGSNEQGGTIKDRNRGQPSEPFC